MVGDACYLACCRYQNRRFPWGMDGNLIAELRNVGIFWGGSVV